MLNVLIVHVSDMLLYAVITNSAAVASNAFTNRSISISTSSLVQISGGAAMTESPTALTINPLRMAASRQKTPACPSGASLSREFLSLTNSNAANIPVVRTSPTIGWSASSRQQAPKYGPISVPAYSAICSLVRMSSVAIPAAQAGCHILLEKPVSHN